MGIALIAIFSFDAIDLFFIGQLGDKPLAAVSFTLPVIWLIYGVGIGFEAGMASCVSRAVGRGDDRQARRLTTDTVVLGTAVALVLCLLGLASIEPVFKLLGATDDLLPLINEYMRIWFWVGPLDFALWSSLASMRARGNTLFESRIIIASALLNLALDPILIFGLFGFPRLEVMGAAVATLIATGIMLVFTLWRLTRRYAVFASPFASAEEILASWKHSLSISLPAMATNAIIPVSSAIVVTMLAAIGVDAVAGYGVAMRIEPLALIPFFALSAVASPFFGQNFSAGHLDRLMEARKQLALFCVVLGIVLAFALSVLIKPLAALFSDLSAVQEIAAYYTWLVAWSWGAHGLVMSVNAAFNGSGRPVPALVISTSRVIVVFLPLALLGKSWFGPPGIFAAAAISNIALGIIAFAWLGRHIRTATD